MKSLKEEKEKLLRSIGYSLARLDLLDVLEEMDGPVHVNEVMKRFEVKMEFRKLTEFIPNERDVKDTGG